MEILRDSIWQFVGALLGLMAIAVTIYIYFLQRSKKRLSYEVLSESLIVSVDKEVKSDIQIMYKGKEIQDMGLVILKLINNGTTSISSNDYESPIFLSFGPNSEILNIEIVERKPKALMPVLKNNQVNAELAPVLLNPKDSFIAKFIVLKPSNIVEIKGRILGVKDIENLTTNTYSKKNNIMLYISLGLFLISISFGYGTIISEAFYSSYFLFPVLFVIQASSGLYFLTKMTINIFQS